MRGNIFFAVGLIVFIFLFMPHAYQVLKTKFKEQHPEKIEIMGCTCVISVVITFFSTAMAYCFLEPVFHNNQVAFWFILFAISDTFFRVICEFAHILLRKLKI